jgi:hypothetical protein
MQAFTLASSRCEAVITARETAISNATAVVFLSTRYEGAYFS